MNNCKEPLIFLAMCTVCALLATLSSEMQSTVDAIYTATFFSFFLLGLLLWAGLQFSIKLEKRRAAGLKRWTNEEIDELEERVKKLEEKKDP